MALVSIKSAVIFSSKSLIKLGIAESFSILASPALSISSTALIFIVFASRASFNFVTALHASFISLK